MGSIAGSIREDDIGTWSENVKLDANRRYLPAYMMVMARYRGGFRGGIHYVDAFAGTGQPVAREDGRAIEGSPLIALGLANPFDNYTFIEQEPWRAERLREHVATRFPHLNVQVIEGDCNSVITDVVTPVVRRDRFARGFAYLDPFTVNLDYGTILALAETEAIEVIINLPTMAINRACLPNDPAKLTPAHYARMDRMWGDRSWFNLVYTEQQGLWGSVVRKAGTTGTERLGRLFKEHRLNPIFKHVGDPLVVTNSTGQPIYCLIHAGPNSTGAKIAAHVFRTQRPAPPATPVTLPLFGAAM